MSFAEEVETLIGKPKSNVLEYKTVLPPSRNIAQLICGFANSEGGYIVLGVKENPDSTLSVVGLSQDFRANEIVHKAIDMLYPKPNIAYQYITHKNKQLYIIKVEKAKETIMAENKKYIRKDGRNISLNELQKYTYANKSDKNIVEVSQLLDDCRTESTSSIIILIEHYQSILKLLDNYQKNELEEDNKQELKILKRILFSSCVDNFETYLSNLLYEIYLSNPNTLKSDEKVEVNMVLDCSDIQEFVSLFATKKIQKLQKGSIKGFIKENKQISNLKAMSENEIESIEKILQIRHLFSHRNGIIDEKFLPYYPNLKLGQEMTLSVVEICDKLKYLINISKKIDTAAIQKYSLAKV
jgi:predicted component of type VI protein secretion system